MNTLFKVRNTTGSSPTASHKMYVLGLRRGEKSYKNIMSRVKSCSHTRVKTFDLPALDIT